MLYHFIDLYLGKYFCAINQSPHKPECIMEPLTKSVLRDMIAETNLEIAIKRLLNLQGTKYIEKWLG